LAETAAVPLALPHGLVSSEEKQGALRLLRMLLQVYSSRTGLFLSAKPSHLIGDHISKTEQIINTRTKEKEEEY
jgi:hypothetical protein